MLYNKFPINLLYILIHFIDLYLLYYALEKDPYKNSQISEGFIGIVSILPQ
jgi:hypothetical protein